MILQLSRLVKREMINKFKKGQEEMIGFALIVVIVAILILVFIAFSIRQPQTDLVESYEVQSFMISMLQYTTNCAENYEPNYRTINQLVFDCHENQVCSDGRTSCEALNSSIQEISEASWQVEGDTPVNGYNLDILINGEEMLKISDGNLSGNYKGYSHLLTRRSNNFELVFTVYSA